MALTSERKELKAQWKTDAEVPSLSMQDVAKHKSKADNWIVIHGKAYDVTQYARDHPGGADALYEVAGSDATSAYEDVGHSEDAREIMHKYLVGVVHNAPTKDDGPKKPSVQVVRRGQSKEQPKDNHLAQRLELCAFALGTMGLVWALRTTHISAGFLGAKTGHASFTSGFLWATATSVAVGAVAFRYMAKALMPSRDFASYPAHLKQPHFVHSTNRPAGILVQSDYQKFELVGKDELAKDIYRFIFALPGKTSVLGLPTGQHVAIRGYYDDETGHHTISRSYTPVSNNSDLGRLELVIRCYPDGKLTGQYLVNLKVGDYVEFRGPTGVMRYRKGMCKSIGMVAGGTGITPMYQLIRAICEDRTDNTGVRLIYSNRSPGDILMRGQLDRFQKQSGGQFKVHYIVDKPTPDWKGGVGFCNKQTLQDQLPAVSDSTRIMLCGPPGMVNAMKNNLVELGFQRPGAVSKISDQVFCF